MYNFVFHGFQYIFCVNPTGSRYVPCSPRTWHKLTENDLHPQAHKKQIPEDGGSLILRNVSILATWRYIQNSNCRPVPASLLSSPLLASHNTQYPRVRATFLESSAALWRCYPLKRHMCIKPTRARISHMVSISSPSDVHHSPDWNSRFDWTHTYIIKFNTQLPLTQANLSFQKFVSVNSRCFRFP